MSIAKVKEKLEDLVQNAAPLEPSSKPAIFTAHGEMKPCIIMQPTFDLVDGGRS